MDKISEWMVDRIDKWHAKTSLPKIVKEFIFLFVVITATLSVELWNRFKK